MEEEKPWEKMPKIKHGVVLDHVPTDRGPLVYLVLFDLLKGGKTADIRTNIPSKKLRNAEEEYGRKWIFKLEKVTPDQDLLDRLAVVGSQNLTINFIEDYKVVNKMRLELPEIVNNGQIYCKNQNCTTVLDRHAAENPRFVLAQKNPVLYECDYCGRQVDQKAIDELVMACFKA